MRHVSWCNSHHHPFLCGIPRLIYVCHTHMCYTHSYVLHSFICVTLWDMAHSRMTRLIHMCYTHSYVLHSFICVTLWDIAPSLETRLLHTWHWRFVCRVTWLIHTPYTSVCCSVLQCVAVCCSVLQCVAVCCSVLQWLIRHTPRLHAVYTASCATLISYTQTYLYT